MPCRIGDHPASHICTSAYGPYSTPHENERTKILSGPVNIIIPFYGVHIQSGRHGLMDNDV